MMSAATTQKYFSTAFMEGVKRRNPGQSEFIQAVQEVAEDVFEFYASMANPAENQINR